MGPTDQSISDQSRHGNLMEVFVAMASGGNVKWERSSAVSIPGNVLYSCYQVYLLPRNTAYDTATKNRKFDHPQHFAQ